MLLLVIQTRAAAIRIVTPILTCKSCMTTMTMTITSRNTTSLWPWTRGSSTICPFICNAPKMTPNCTNGITIDSFLLNPWCRVPNNHVWADRVATMSVKLLADCRNYSNQWAIIMRQRQATIRQYHHHHHLVSSIPLVAIIIGNLNSTCCKKHPAPCMPLIAPDRVIDSKCPQIRASIFITFA